MLRAYESSPYLLYKPETDSDHGEYIPVTDMYSESQIVAGTKWLTFWMKYWYIEFTVSSGVRLK